MFKLNNTFAIGCLVQFYEIEIIEDFIKSLKFFIEKKKFVEKICGTNDFNHLGVKLFLSQNKYFLSDA